ncbi:MAG: EF-P beta-lysylation protein EpmB [Planctomycetales bacterium]
MAIVASPSNSVSTSSGSTSSDSTSSGNEMSDSWQQSMRSAERDPIALCRRLGLPSKYEALAERAARLFGLFVPEEYIARIRHADPHDPLLRQVLPLAEELEPVEGFSNDPVGDAAAVVDRGLLHKYQSRVLLVTTGACAVHCRYCFRRHFPYSETPHTLSDWQPALQQIASDPEIDEVILSGGDPLTIVDGRLSELVEQIEQIGHVGRLRVHSRLPVMIPSRVTDSLLNLLCGGRLTSIFVVHINHAAEIDQRVATALTRLVDAGLVVLNQSVLLNGVNDSADALVDLSRRLVDLRVMPYYLHQLDRVQGAAHFEVPIARGMEMIQQMRSQLPGYAVPRYVQEIGGETHKRVLA